MVQKAQALGTLDDEAGAWLNSTSEDARDEARRRGQRIPWLTIVTRRLVAGGHDVRVMVREVPTRRASTISTSRDSSATSGTTTSFGGRCPDVTTCITA